MWISLPPHFRSPELVSLRNSKTIGKRFAMRTLELLADVGV
jgi:hypothetical protein